MKPGEWARAVANVVNLSTPLGLVIAAIGRSRLTLRGGGIVLAEGYRLSFPVAGAFTVGNVVLVPGRTMAEIEAINPDVLAHEDAHAWQYSYCLGLPFLPAYAVAMGWSWLRTGDRAAANVFEVQADLAKGGYTDYPKRRLREGFSALLKRP